MKKEEFIMNKKIYFLCLFVTGMHTLKSDLASFEKGVADFFGAAARDTVGAVTGVVASAVGGIAGGTLQGGLTGVGSGVSQGLKDAGTGLGSAIGGVESGVGGLTSTTTQGVVAGASNFSSSLQQAGLISSNSNQQASQQNPQQQGLATLQLIVTIPNIPQNIVQACQSLYQQIQQAGSQITQQQISQALNPILSSIQSLLIQDLLSISKMKGLSSSIQNQAKQMAQKLQNTLDPNVFVQSLQQIISFISNSLKKIKKQQSNNTRNNNNNNKNKKNN